MIPRVENSNRNGYDFEDVCSLDPNPVENIQKASVMSELKGRHARRKMKIAVGAKMHEVDKKGSSRVNFKHRPHEK